jgi:hypothetical protein
LKKRVRALIGDPDGDFATDAYLVPLINQAYDAAINYLAGTCSPFMTQLQVVPNLPAGTVDLTEQAKPDNPLFGLMNPLEIEYKQAGQPETNYCFAKRLDILPNVSPAGGWPTRGLCWEWRSYILYLTPLGYAADFRVRGEFRPPALLQDGNVITVHPLMTPALAFLTAALIGSERLNGSYVQDYGPKGENTLDDIAAELVRQQQGTSSRLGRMGGRGRGTGYPGGYSLGG